MTGSCSFFRSSVPLALAASGSLPLYVVGVLIGLGSILSSNGYINNIAGMSACLQ